MLETYQLEQLIAFAEYKTLSRAAEVLHISQPSLSRTMQQIESEFQVSLFERQKNKITLNENGRLAVSYARKIVDDVNDMVFHVRSFDRMNNTISVGSCAPMPSQLLTKLLRSIYPDMTLSSEVKKTDVLTVGLFNDTYDFIILPQKPDNTSGLFIKTFSEEHLMFCPTDTHKFAHERSLHLYDINGENMIVMPNLGFWRDIIDEKMPDSKFFEQTDRTAFEELIQASILPYFTTDIAFNDYKQPKNRVYIPLIDPEVNVTFFLIVKESKKQKFTQVFKNI